MSKYSRATKRIKLKALSLATDKVIRLTRGVSPRWTLDDLAKACKVSRSALWKIRNRDYKELGVKVADKIIDTKVKEVTK